MIQSEERRGDRGKRTVSGHYGLTCMLGAKTETHRSQKPRDPQTRLAQRTIRLGTRLNGWKPKTKRTLEKKTLRGAENTDEDRGHKSGLRRRPLFRVPGTVLRA